MIPNEYEFKVKKFVDFNNKKLHNRNCIESWWEISVKFIGSSWNRKVGVPPNIVRC